MTDLADKAQLIQYLQAHGLYTKKGLGQNFLVDRGALERIVDSAEIRPDDCILEVGPGLGTLTQHLVGAHRRVVSVEIDDKIANLLVCQFSSINDSRRDPFTGQFPINNQCSNIKNCKIENSLKIAKLKIDNSRLDIVNGDILKVNVPELLGDCRSYKVVANIPYYITSKILRLFLEQTPKKPETIVILTQKELAERVCAKPGEMSLLSVSVQAYGNPEIVGIVKRDSFFPAPEVDSAILRIAIINDQFSIFNDKEKLSQKDFFRCVRIGFASRRKTLLNNLSAGYRLEKKVVLDILSEAGLDEYIRAQELSIAEWEKLSISIVKLFNC
ncbi:MAG TPA: rRNA adenine dimethyltransferase family protein [bacterium]|nr:rRNA adenine dimethyltransferase family protein [bacterium]